MLNENYITNLNGVKNTTQKLFTVRKVMLQENAIASAGEMENISNNIIKNSSNLKDNGIDAVPVEGSPLQSLLDELPFKINDRNTKHLLNLLNKG